MNFLLHQCLSSQVTYNVNDTANSQCTFLYVSPLALQSKPVVSGITEFSWFQSIFRRIVRIDHSDSLLGRAFHVVIRDTENTLLFLRHTRPILETPSFGGLGYSALFIQ